MSDHLGTSGVFINSIVGEGTKFVGDLELNGLLRIDGDFIGNIKTNGKVLIGKNGRAECTITAETVVIGGVVKGDVVSSGKVVILSTGMLIGNISTPRLISEDGVILNGLCMISNIDDSPVSFETKSSNIIEGKEIDRYNPSKIIN
ncbi:MAG: polymer-forming cytoskeletal protein [Spirochaetia bacterium]|jgi:cytoskeletal protein CcmA (bactofilin family)|nr:polymer-forming cytoskeletal protein [Spirochaetia bacterium]